MSTAALPSAAPALPPHVLGYRALKLWQRALDLAADAHRLAHTFPEADQPALATDLRRAAAGVPAAIAASSMALDRADQQRALQGATAALARVETLAALAERLGVLSSGDATAFLFASGDVTRLLRGLTRSVAARSVGSDAGNRAAGEAAAASAAAGGAAAAPPVQHVAEPVPAAATPGGVVMLAESTAAVPAAPPSMRGTGRRRGAARAGTPTAP